MTRTTSTGNGHTSGFGGTSAACAYAAGAAACIQSAIKIDYGPFLTPGQVKSTLLDSDDPIQNEETNIIKPRLNLDSSSRSAKLYSGHTPSTAEI